MEEIEKWYEREKKFISSVYRGERLEQMLKAVERNKRDILDLYELYMKKFKEEMRKNYSYFIEEDR